MGEGNNSLFSPAYSRKKYRRKFNFSVVTRYSKVCCVSSLVSWRKRREDSIESVGWEMPMYIGWDAELLPFPATISVEILWMEGVDHHFRNIKNVCNLVKTETDIKLLTENPIKNGYISSQNLCKIQVDSIDSLVMQVTRSEQFSCTERSSCFIFTLNSIQDNILLTWKYNIGGLQCGEYLEHNVM